MQFDHSYLDPIHLAIREFEEAVKKHEHRRFLKSEVLERQDVDAHRRRLIDSVVSVVREEARQASIAAERRWLDLMDHREDVRATVALGGRPPP